MHILITLVTSMEYKYLNINLNIYDILFRNHYIIKKVFLTNKLLQDNHNN